MKLRSLISFRILPWKRNQREPAFVLTFSKSSLFTSFRTLTTALGGIESMPTQRQSRTLPITNTVNMYDEIYLLKIITQTVDTIYNKCKTNISYVSVHLFFSLVSVLSDREAFLFQQIQIQMNHEDNDKMAEVRWLISMFTQRQKSTS